MQALTKKLIFSILVLGTSCSNIYSMDTINVIKEDSINESSTINDVNVPLIDYNNDALPTDEQMLKYKNVLPITFNNLDKVKNCFKWLNEHQENDNKLIKEILIKIYNLSNYLSCEHCTYWATVDSCIESYWETKYAWNKTAPRDEDHCAPMEPTNDSTTQLLKGLTININDINNIIATIANNGQKVLNPDKYKNFTIPQNKEINLMQALYYISNQLVLLSQDIIYNIDKQINDNKDSNNRINIKSTVIDPSYSVLESTISELKESVCNILKQKILDLNDPLVPGSSDIIEKMIKQMEKIMENNKKIDNQQEYAYKKAVDPRYSVLQTTISKFKKLDGDTSEKAKQYDKYYKRLNHNLRQNDLNLHLDDFKKDSLGNYAIDSSYAQSNLRQNIFEVEKTIIELVENQREIFKKKTIEIKQPEIKEIEKQNNKTIDELEDQYINEINDIKEQIKMKTSNTTEQTINEVNELNGQLDKKREELRKIQYLISDSQDCDKVLFDEIRSKLTDSHFKYAKDIKEIVKNINNKENNITDSELVNKSNKYLKSMFEEIDYFINKEMSQYSVIKNKLDQYKNEIENLKTTIKEEMTKNIEQYKIQESNYIDNIKQLLDEYNNK